MFSAGTECSYTERVVTGVSPVYHYHKKFDHSFPYIINGFPVNWQVPSFTETLVGRLAIFFQKRDVTYFRGGITEIQSFGSREPFGDTALVVSFANITPFDNIGTGDLSWLTDENDDDFSAVELYFVDDNDDIVGDALFEGEAVDYTVDNKGCKVTCIGALYVADFLVRPPQFREKPVRHSFLIQENLRLAGGRRNLRTREPKIVGTPTFKTTYTGDGGTLLNSYINRLLSDMVEDNGDQWTLMLDRPRQPVIRLKDFSTVHWTLFNGVPGVEARLTTDKTQAVNAIYGEGTDAAGTVWRNQFRLESGVTVYRPLVEDTQVAFFTTDTFGEENTLNPDFDNNKIRKERWVNFGSGISIEDAQPVAEKLYDRDTTPGWTGTITLQSDPAEGHKFRMQAGENVLLRGFQGSDLLLHINQVRHNVESLTTTLTVDSKARDANLVDALLARKRKAMEDPTRATKNTSSHTITDTKQPWDRDAGFGFIPYASKAEKDLDPRTDGSNYSPPSVNPEYYMNVTARQWHIQAILVADNVQIARTELHAYDNNGNYLPTSFVWGIWREPIGRENLPSDPFAEGNIDILSNTSLPSWYYTVMILWGGWSQRCGYWPGLESRGGEKTGQMYDEGPWTCNLRTGQTIAFVCIYSEDDAYYRGKLIPGVT